MKRFISMLVLVAVVACGCSKSDSSTTNAALDGDLKLESGQKLWIAQVSAIKGNEVTLAMAKEVDSSSMKSGMGKPDFGTSSNDSKKTDSSSNSRPQMPSQDNSDSSKSSEKKWTDARWTRRRDARFSRW